MPEPAGAAILGAVALLGVVLVKARGRAWSPHRRLFACVIYTGPFVLYCWLVWSAWPTAGWAVLAALAFVAFLFVVAGEARRARRGPHPGGFLGEEDPGWEDPRVGPARRGGHGRSRPGAR